MSSIWAVGLPVSYLTNVYELPMRSDWYCEDASSSLGMIPASGNGCCGIVCDGWISPFRSPFVSFLVFFFLDGLLVLGSIWDTNREYRIRAAWPLEISRSDAT